MVCVALGGAGCLLPGGPASLALLGVAAAASGAGAALNF